MVGLKLNEIEVNLMPLKEFFSVESATFQNYNILMKHLFGRL